MAKVGVDGMTVLECILEKQCVKMWTGFNWLRIRSNGGILWKR